MKKTKIIIAAVELIVLASFCTLVSGCFIFTGG